jgi:hypothetical protein
MIAMCAFAAFRTSLKNDACWFSKEEGGRKSRDFNLSQKFMIFCPNHQNFNLQFEVNLLESKL